MKALLLLLAISLNAAPLAVRKFQPSLSPFYDTEQSGGYVIQGLNIEPKQLALVVMDAWKSHANDGWLARAQENMQDHLVPLVNLCRSNGVQVIHIYNDGESAIPILDVDWDLVALNENSSATLHKRLTQAGIKVLAYSGYSTNWCVRTRPCGFLEMHWRGWPILVVREATIAYEAPWTLKDEGLKDYAILDIEMHFGWSVSTEGIRQWLETE